MATLTETPELIHIEVREHYSERARNVGSSCCGSNGGSNCSDAITLYGAEELALLPDDMAGATWGCGNPTAIAALQPGSVVLDLGSGGGFDVVLAAKKVGATGFVYGVDMTDDMLELARRNAANAGVTNVEFLKGQIEDIPLPEKTVDVIISNCVINLSPDKGQTLAEAYRVLRPGGKLAVSDIVVDGVLDDLPVSEQQIRAALSWAGCIAGALTVDQYRALLAAAGFVDIQVDVQHRYAIEEFGEDAQMGAQGIPADVAKELVRRFTSSNISAHRPA